MRVTQNYSINSLLRRVNQSRERIYLLQRNLATGKRINRISDDPEQVESVLRFRKLLKLNQRFEGNLKNALDFMGITSQALDDAVNVLSHVKEITIQAVDATNDDEWSAYAKQVDQMLKQLVDVANTRFKNRYIFGGTQTGTVPFVLAPDGSAVTANANGIDGELKTEIGEFIIEDYNISGQETFYGGVDVFQLLIDLRDAMNSQDISTVQGFIDSLDDAADQIMQQNSLLGAKMNRFEMFLQQYQTQDVKLQELLSDIEDTDMAKAISELQIHETGLNTALQVLARTLNISLVDFMQ